MKPQTRTHKTWIFITCDIHTAVNETRALLIAMSSNCPSSESGLVTWSITSENLLLYRFDVQYQRLVDPWKDMLCMSVHACRTCVRMIHGWDMGWIGFVVCNHLDDGCMHQSSKPRRFYNARQSRIQQYWSDRKTISGRWYKCRFSLTDQKIQLAYGNSRGRWEGTVLLK